jgi:hypothetical protein
MFSSEDVAMLVELRKFCRGSIVMVQRYDLRSDEANTRVAPPDHLRFGAEIIAKLARQCPAASAVHICRRFANVSAALCKKEN